MPPPFLFQKKACNVVAFVISSSGGPSPTLTGVAVTENGELRQHQTFSYICIPFIDKHQPENYEADIVKIKDFIKDNQARLIVIGANSPDARNLKKMLSEKVVTDEDLISKLSAEPYISYGSMDVPQIAANSPAYSTHKSLQLPIKQGLSLARFKQSPVNETLKLWNEDEAENMHIFSLNLHPFQKSVPQDRLVEALRNVAVSSVNAIGVDLHATV